MYCNFILGAQFCYNYQTYNNAPIVRKLVRILYDDDHDDDDDD